jgi:hypothetical protein
MQPYKTKCIECSKHHWHKEQYAMTFTWLPERLQRIANLQSCMYFFDPFFFKGLLVMCRDSLMSLSLVLPSLRLTMLALPLPLLVTTTSIEA